MANICDYAEWMKGIPLSGYPIQTEDASILCQLSYCILDDCFTSGLPLKDVSTYVKEHEPLQVAIMGGDPLVEELLHICGQSARYGNLILIGYRSVFDPEESVQFSAMTFLHKEDQTGFIAYRGTDGSIAGWKEDFRISYEKIASQELAKNYAEEMIHANPDIEHWYIGGHSKGGNLALYTACALPTAFTHGWIFDGPGFCPQVLDQGQIRNVQNKLTAIEPVYSIVGRLFEAEINDRQIIESTAQGINQHNMTSWVIEHGKLKQADKHDPQSDWMSKAIDEWLIDKPLEQRKEFVDELFASFSTDPGDNFDSLTARGPSAFEEALVRFLSSSELAKKTAMDLPATALFGKGKTRKNLEETLEWFRKDTDNIWKSFILIIAGIIFMLVSDHIMGIMVMLAMTILTVYEFYLTIRHLKENHWNFEEEQMRINIAIIFAVTAVVLLLKKNALFVLGSLIFGIGFLTCAYQQAAKAMDHKEDRKWCILWGIEAVFLTIFGFSYLIMPEWSASAYATGVGIFLISDGIYRLILHYNGQLKKR